MCGCGVQVIGKVKWITRGVHRKLVIEYNPVLMCEIAAGLLTGFMHKNIQYFTFIRLIPNISEILFNFKNIILTETYKRD